MTTAQAETRIKQDKDWRKRLDDVLHEMKQATDKPQSSPGCDSMQINEKFTGSGRHRSLSITHLEDSIMRLGMDMKEVNESNPGSAPNPYPQSYNPENARVEPTSEGLKL